MGGGGHVGMLSAACDELVTLTNVASLCPLTDTNWHDPFQTWPAQDLTQQVRLTICHMSPWCKFFNKAQLGRNLSLFIRKVKVWSRLGHVYFSPYPVSTIDSGLNFTCKWRSWSRVQVQSLHRKSKQAYSFLHVFITLDLRNFFEECGALCCRPEGLRFDTRWGDFF
jgi:hypothetical protein